MRAQPGLCGNKTCEIILEHRVTVDDSTIPGELPMRGVYFAQMSNARLLVAAATLDYVLVFDGTGNFIQRIGRRGEAPGEFTRIVQPIVGEADSIYVHDVRLERLTIISPDLTVVRTIPNFGASPNLSLGNGLFVAARQLRTEDRIGYPIHLLNTEGDILRSFGADVPQHRPDLSFVTTRVVGPGVAGTIWAAAPGRYVLERWDPIIGDRHERVEVSSSWSIGQNGPSLDPFFTRPSPLVTQVSGDDGGEFVWVMTRQADAQWQPADSVVWTPASVESYDNKYDFVLEAIEIRSGKVLARKQFGRAPWFNESSGLLATVKTLSPNAVGSVIVDVWSLLLQTQEATQ